MSIANNDGKIIVDGRLSSYNCKMKMTSILQYTEKHQLNILGIIIITIANIIMTIVNVSIMILSIYRYIIPLQQYHTMSLLLARLQHFDCSFFFSCLQSTTNTKFTVGASRANVNDITATPGLTRFSNPLLLHGLAGLCPACSQTKQLKISLSSFFPACFVIEK